MWLKKNELVWQKIKRFKKDALIKKYINAYSNANGHYFMDLVGNYELSDFNKEFGYVEKDCLQSLKQLRSSRIYTDLLLNYYIQNNKLKMTR